MLTAFLLTASSLQPGTKSTIPTMDNNFTHSSITSIPRIFKELEQLIDIRGNTGFHYAQSIDDSIRIKIDDSVRAKLDTLRIIYRNSETSLNLTDVSTGLERLEKLEDVICEQEASLAESVIRDRAGALNDMLKEATQNHLDIIENMIDRIEIANIKIESLSDLQTLARVGVQI